MRRHTWINDCFYCVRPLKDQRIHCGAASQGAPPQSGCLACSYVSPAAYPQQPQTVVHLDPQKLLCNIMIFIAPLNITSIWSTVNLSMADYRNF